MHQYKILTSLCAVLSLKIKQFWCLGHKSVVIDMRVHFNATCMSFFSLPSTENVALCICPYRERKKPGAFSVASFTVTVLLCAPSPSHAASYSFFLFLSYIYPTIMFFSGKV